MQQSDAPRVSIGGVGISCIDMKGAVDALFRIAQERSGGYFAFTCAHGIVDSQKDEQLKSILNNGRMAMPDGMPLVWLGRLKQKAMRRVTAPDFFENVMRNPRARTIRHYFYGGSPETIERIARRATEMLGAEMVAGWMSPPMRAAGAVEDPEVIAEINARKPHVIWVGLGLPKQEYWMSNHTGQLPSSLLLGVGAAFDWFAGTQPRAPRILQAIGMEWAHRVASEPARLWPRYRKVVPSALKIFAREMLHR
jgi:N-acetylglucosaminyldiphosphoundecaprenol N-acetyl-beta-D-mannosaminyltransferase